MALNFLPTPSKSFSIPPNPLLSLSKPLKNPKSLKNPKPLLSSSSSSSPIFLPHLEQTSHADVDEADNDDDGTIDGNEEEDEDPIRAFFNSRPDLPDPSHQGRTSRQRNRRTTWHLSQTLTSQPDTDTDTTPLDPHPPSPEPDDDDNPVARILELSASLPENATLGDFLPGFEGRVGEGECVELLGRMEEVGSVRECLYLFEWMRTQEPPLATPRACSAMLALLGRAGMGEEARVLFDNLPVRRKEFMDVRLYNSAISALSCAGR